MSDQTNKTVTPPVNTEVKQEKKNKKIEKMNLKEIEEAIENTNKNQGGLYSKYALELLKIQKSLTNNK